MVISVFRTRIVFVLIATLLASRSLAAVPIADATQGPIRFVTNVSPVANLFYQMECLGGRIRCSQAAYRALWEELGPLRNYELLAISEFSDVLDVYGFRAQLRARGGKPPTSYERFGREIVDIGPPPTQSFSLLNRIRIASYGAVTLEELSDRLNLFMHPDDAAAVSRSMHTLWPRFIGWWESGAAEALSQFDKSLADLLEEQNRHTLPSVAAFFGIQPPDSGLLLTVHLVAHPTDQSSTRAEALENHAVVEVLAGELPDTRLGVIVHELVHYLFAIAPKSIHDIRLEGALRSENPRAAAALGLTNETLAAAIGNGFVEEQVRGEKFDDYFDRDESFYAQSDVDIAAKSVYPLVRAYLRTGRTIDARFVDQFYSLVSDALGDKLDSLASRLRVSAYIASDEELAQSMRRLPRLLGMSSLYGSSVDRGEKPSDSVLHRHSYLNGVVLLRDHNRSEAAELLPEATGRLEGLRSTDARSCAFTRESGASVYFVVVDSPDISAETLVDYMRVAPSCDSLARSGK